MNATSSCTLATRSISPALSKVMPASLTPAMHAEAAACCQSAMAFCCTSQSQVLGSSGLHRALGASAMSSASLSGRRSTAIPAKGLSWSTSCSDSSGFLNPRLVSTPAATRSSLAASASAASAGDRYLPSSPPSSSSPLSSSSGLSAFASSASDDVAVRALSTDMEMRGSLGGPMSGSMGGLRMFSARADEEGSDEDLLSEEDEEDFLSSEEGEDEEEDDDDELAIESLGLAASLQNGLMQRGITRLFPIQRAVLVPSMEGRDIIARARTGTGKTLAFGIPILERVTRELEANRGRRSSRGSRCLVLAPTRELAKQVEREFQESAPHMTTVCVYGGVSIEGQIRQLKRGVDAVVGTPGRIIDLIERGALVLSDVQFCVLDEADQMLAVGFEEDVERIMEQLPVERQTSLFSATMPSWVRKLSRKYLANPLTIDLVGDSEEKLAEGIRIMCVRTTHSSKRTLLNDLITVHAGGGKTIVFTQTKRDADEVALSLTRTLGCEALHGDIAQVQRERTLQAFREGRFSVLVATDVAARGLDIPNVDLVIHYEIPNDPETFVHRSGRTGRAGKTGIALLMYTEQQTRTLRTIEKDIGSSFERIAAPRVEQVLQASANQSSQILEKVHPELAEVFLPAAEQLLQEKGPAALAAALAFMGGHTQLPAQRSLLTNEEGWVTVRMVRSPRSRNAPLTSPRVVLGTLSEIYRPAADNVGKIKLLSDRNVDGAVFDLPEKHAKALVALAIDNGDVFDLPKELPALIEDDSRGGRDNYGRGMDRGRRGGGDRRGGPSDRRGGGSFERGRGGGDSRGSRYQDSSSSSFGRGDRFKPLSRRNFSSEGGGSSWGGDFDREDFGGRSSEKRSYDRPTGERSAFSGVCFLCRKPGHRASDCPVVASR